MKIGVTALTVLKSLKLCFKFLSYWNFFKSTIN